MKRTLTAALALAFVAGAAMAQDNHDHDHDNNGGQHQGGQGAGQGGGQHRTARDPEQPGTLYRVQHMDRIIGLIRGQVAALQKVSAESFEQGALGLTDRGSH